MSGQDDFDRNIFDIIPERYDADEDGHQARAGDRLRSTLVLGAAVVVVGGLVGLGWSFFSDSSSTPSGVPVIKADDRPLRTRPDDRGGMQVPNQDKLVYERMEHRASDAQVERLLPSPEQPVPLAQPAKEPVIPTLAEPPAQPSSDVQPSSVVQPQALAQAPAPAEIRPAIAQSASSKPMTVEQPVTTKAAEKIEKVTTLPKAEVAKLTPPKPVASGNFLIQLGALREAAAADREWARIQRANSDLLAGLKSDVIRVELDKGTFWRLRAGPLNEDGARKLCADLKARNQGCIVVRK